MLVNKAPSTIFINGSVRLLMATVTWL